MRIPEAYTARQRRSFAALQELSWQVAARLFDETEVAQHVEAVTHEAVQTFTEPGSAQAAEAWILKELVRRAERTRILAAKNEQRRARDPVRGAQPEPHWDELHASGELAPLLAQLPRVLARAFALQYVEKASLCEMMHRTGASAGVVTHRVAEARRRLAELATAYPKTCAD